MRRISVLPLLCCVCCSALAAAGPRPEPAIPSWFWGCWRITEILSPRVPNAPAGGLSQPQIDALVGTRVVLRRGCCSRTARTGLGYPETGETILAGPAFRARLVSRRQFWRFGYFLPSAIGINGPTVTELTAQLPPGLSDLDFLAETVYLRPADRSIVLDVEGAEFLAKKLPPGTPGCVCKAPPGHRKFIVVGATPPPPWWRTELLPEAIRDQIAAIWRCANAACAARRFAALPHRDSTAKAVYFATLCRLRPSDNTAEIDLLKSIPAHDATYGRLLMLPRRLYTHVNVAFARAVARHPKYLPRFLYYGTLFEDNLYPVLAAAVCRREPAAFRRALATLPAPDRADISEARVDPKTCRPIPFHLAQPELHPPPGLFPGTAAPKPPPTKPAAPAPIFFRASKGF
ncbi:MAG: hypothetical protein ACRD13_14100 [Terriglobales bacterium]